MRLAPDQLDRFRRDGYLLSDGFLEAEEIEHLRACYLETAERLAAEQALENVQSGGDRDEDFQVYQIRICTAHCISILKCKSRCPAVVTRDNNMPIRILI